MTIRKMERTWKWKRNDNENDNVKTTNENDNDNKDREREEGKHNLKIITIMGGGREFNDERGEPEPVLGTDGRQHAQPEFGQPPARRRSERAGGLASPGCAQLCWQVGPRAAKRGMYSRSIGVARASVG